jgi:DNA-binding GntR family transcriptional regulator
VERKAKTRVLALHSAIRQDILTGRLLPGERLSPSALAQQHGVSLSVAREALVRLGEQGMVVSQPQLGFQVMPLSREDLLDLTATRLDIETLALRRSVERGDVEWRSQLVAAHYVLEHTEQYAQLDPPLLSEDWARAHHDFHQVLLKACGSTRLLEFAESLRDSAEVYRRWSTPIGGRKSRDIAAEHRAILDAVQEGDADLAAARLAEHISHTTDVLLKHTDAADKGA